MENKNKVPLPQANDFEKVVRILNVNSENQLSNISSLSNLLDGITDRQVSYYLAAARYVGIIDDTKQFTEVGINLRTMNSYQQKIELVRLLLTDKIIGTIYISEKVLETSFELDDVIEIIKKDYPSYCDGIYERRGNTILSWVSWIKSIMNEEN